MNWFKSNTGKNSLKIKNINNAVGHIVTYFSSIQSTDFMKIIQFKKYMIVKVAASSKYCKKVNLVLGSNSNIKTKLLSKISPNNRFVINADLISYKRGIATGVSVGKIDNTNVCQGEFTFISPHDMPIPKIKKSK